MASDIPRRPAVAVRPAFIGGGNMAGALAAGLIGRRCSATDVLVIDPDSAARARWHEQGVEVAEQAGPSLSERSLWVLAVKPQVMREVVAACRPWLRPDTLVVSVAAGIRADTLAAWLGSAQQPWRRLVRSMPNTPALIGRGVTGLLALDGVDDAQRQAVETLFSAVGRHVWVDDDAAIDAVTALSGSGPAYVFRFLEGLVQGGEALGLSPEQSRTLALATVIGAAELADLSPDSLATLRERVTSKGGTTAAALGVLDQHGLVDIIGQAMTAAAERAVTLSREFGA